MGLLVAVWSVCSVCYRSQGRQCQKWSFPLNMECTGAIEDRAGSGRFPYGKAPSDRETSVHHQPGQYEIFRTAE